MFPTDSAARRYRILLVSHEPEATERVRAFVEEHILNAHVDVVGCAADAYDLLTDARYDMVIAEHALPGASGSDVQGEVERRAPATVRILLTGRLDDAPLPAAVARASTATCRSRERKGGAGTSARCAMLASPRWGLNFAPGLRWARATGNLYHSPAPLEAVRFVPAHRLPSDARRGAVACDGACDGAGLEMGHWPGSRTPTAFRADLGVESALRFAASEERARFDVATNDHHDADGVLSLFAALRPDDARPHAERLVGAAAFSDFRHGSDEEALKLAATLDGLRASPLSPLAGKLEGLDPRDGDALATEHALAALPGLLDDVEKHWALWTDELAWFQASRDALQSGHIAVTELAPARLTIVEADREPHPAVVERVREGDLVLTAVRAADGFLYHADWRRYAWAQTVSPARPAVRALSLEKLCLPLNSLEPGQRGRWLHDAPTRARTEALRFAAPDGTLGKSKLGPGEVAEKLAWFLVERSAPVRKSPNM